MAMNTALYKIITSFPPFRGRNQILNLFFRGSTAVKSIYGPRLRVRGWEYTTHAAISGIHGVDLKNLILKMPANGVFVDIGSNQGIFSLIASNHLEHGLVFSFEPNPLVFEDLLWNIRANECKNIIPLNFALGESAGIAKIKFNSYHTGLAHVDSGAKSRYGMEAQVAMLPPCRIGFLEEAIGEAICLCKIDTEGFEVEILRSLRSSTLMDKITAFFVEIDEAQLSRYGHNARQIYEIMGASGLVGRHEPGYSSHYDEIFFRPGCCFDEQ